MSRPASHHRGHHRTAVDTHPSPPSDAALVEHLTRCGQGDPRAFARLYDATADRLLHLALLVTQDRARSEVATVAAYVDIWRRAPTFDLTRSSPMSWLMGVVCDHARAVQPRASPVWEPPSVPAAPDSRSSRLERPTHAVPSS